MGQAMGIDHGRWRDHDYPYRHPGATFTEIYCSRPDRWGDQVGTQRRCVPTTTTFDKESQCQRSNVNSNLSRLRKLPLTMGFGRLVSSLIERLPFRTSTINWKR